MRLKAVVHGDKNPLEGQLVLDADRKYYEARLEDLSLLRRAIRCDGLWAVPVGGIRKGGHLSLNKPAQQRAVDTLRACAGFPALRISGGLVEWGEPVDDIERPGETGYDAHVRVGRHYGYKMEAINRLAQTRTDTKRCPTCGKQRSAFREFRKGAGRMKRRCIHCEDRQITRRSGV